MDGVLRGSCDDGTWVDAVFGCCAARGLLVPGRGGDVVDIDNVHLSLSKASVRSTIATCRMTYEGSVGPTSQTE